MRAASVSLTELNIIMDHTLENFYQFERYFVVVFTKHMVVVSALQKGTEFPLADLLE